MQMIPQYPQKDQIRNKLDEIMKQLKIAGYVINVIPEFDSKMITVYDREVIITDSNQWHHFQDEGCSCSKR